MFSRRPTARNKSSRRRKTGIKDENIDRQILVIHQTMVEKLIAQPELIKTSLRNLEERHEQGRIGYGPYLTWHALLEMSDNPEAMQQAICEDSPKMRRLRRTTPLVGILTEEERQRALEQDALGTTHISTLF